MKSAKIYPTYKVGDCSTEYPVVRKPKSLFEMAWILLAFTFIAWMFGYPLFNEIVAPLLIFVGVL